MKKVIVIFILLLTPFVYSQQTKFIIGAEHVSSFHDFGEYDDPIPHSNSYWDTVKSLGLNYVGLKYGQVYGSLGRVSVADITADLDRAAARAIDVYLTNGFDRINVLGDPYYPKRWLYQVEKVPDNSLNDFSNVQPT